MKRLDLQLFAETVQGSKLVYLYRILKFADTKDATRLAFTTDNERSVKKDTDTTATKDGTIVTPKAAEISISATSFLAKGDTMVSDLEDAMISDERIEIWEVNLEEPATTPNKFKGKYYQGYLVDFKISGKSEDNVEVSLEFSIDGVGVKGDVTVSVEQQNEALYIYKDTVREA